MPQHATTVSLPVNIITPPVVGLPGTVAIEGQVYRVALCHDVQPDGHVTPIYYFDREETPGAIVVQEGVVQCLTGYTTCNCSEFGQSGYVNCRHTIAARYIRNTKQ